MNKEAAYEHVRQELLNLEPSNAIVKAQDVCVAIQRIFKLSKADAEEVVNAYLSLFDGKLRNSPIPMISELTDGKQVAYVHTSIHPYLGTVAGINPLYQESIAVHFRNGLKRNFAPWQLRLATEKECLIGEIDPTIS